MVCVGSHAGHMVCVASHAGHMVCIQCTENIMVILFTVSSLQSIAPLSVKIYHYPSRFRAISDMVKMAVH